jgi:hypothetical protein
MTARIATYFFGYDQIGSAEARQHGAHIFLRRDRRECIAFVILNERRKS